MTLPIQVSSYIDNVNLNVSQMALKDAIDYVDGEIKSSRLLTSPEATQARIELYQISLDLSIKLSASKFGKVCPLNIDADRVTDNRILETHNNAFINHLAD